MRFLERRAPPCVRFAGKGLEGPISFSTILHVDIVTSTLSLVDLLRGVVIYYLFDRIYQFTSSLFFFSSSPCSSLGRKQGHRKNRVQGGLGEGFEASGVGIYYLFDRIYQFTYYLLLFLHLHVPFWVGNRAITRTEFKEG